LRLRTIPFAPLRTAGRLRLLDGDPPLRGSVRGEQMLSVEYPATPHLTEPFTAR
jgi:hypothetical protein